MPRLSEDARRESWFIAGPTASGKSDVALALADRLVEFRRAPQIVAMDSMTLYRGMDIGTAKPSAEEQQRYPHHLFDILDINETFSVADYLQRADNICEQFLVEGSLPIFVGGTGLYLRSILRGIFEGPPADSQIRKDLNHQWAEPGGQETLVRRLSAVDPMSADRIESNDGRRIIRALEVFEITGKPLSAFQTEEQPDTIAKKVFWLEPDRAVLHERINTRVDRMLNAGWLEEAQRLLETDLEIGPTARRALGYEELFSVIQNGDDLADATERIKARTRQFAKRQHTWFRNLDECRAVPVAPGESADSIAGRLIDLVGTGENH